jgi:hypothetical protein
MPRREGFEKVKKQARTGKAGATGTSLVQRRGGILSNAPEEYMAAMIPYPDFQQWKMEQKASILESSLRFMNQDGCSLFYAPNSQT